MLLLSILFNGLAFAGGPDGTHGFRTGVCIGASPECFGTNIKLGYAGKFGGFNVGLPFIPLDGIYFPASASVSVRFYPKSVLEGHKKNWRPYVYGGGAIWYDDFITLVGIGAGADVHLTQSRRLCLQPSLGGMVADFFGAVYMPSASLAVMYTF